MDMGPGPKDPVAWGHGAQGSMVPKGPWGRGAQGSKGHGAQGTKGPRGQGAERDPGAMVPKGLKGQAAG